MNITKSLFILFIFINIFFVGVCNCSSILVNISFLISLTSIIYILHHIIYTEKLFSPYLVSYFIFSYLFFFIAPLSQINSLPSTTNTSLHIFKDSFPNTLPYSEFSVIILNLFIFLWNIIFIAAYTTFKKIYKIEHISTWKISNHVKGNFPLYILIVFLLSFIIIISQYDFILQRILYKNFLTQNLSMQKMLIIVKTYFSVPFIGVIMTIIYLKNVKKINTNSILITFFFFLIFTAFIFVKNPLIEKRNALGPIFITLIIFIKPRLLRTNKKFITFMFISMVIAFPLISVLTHSKIGLKELFSKPNHITKAIKKEGIFNEFNTLHYDAYANTLATIDYVKKHNITYGNQFFAGILFFIPRSIWTSKPESTGKFIGQYLMTNYNMWFDNISNPFLSEGIINFGFLSLLIFPLILAWFIVIMLRWQYSNDLFKQVVAIYFSIHLIFLLRGDFTNGWAYFVGTFIGIYFIPKSIIYIVNNLPKKKVKN